MDYVVINELHCKLLFLIKIQVIRKGKGIKWGEVMFHVIACIHNNTCRGSKKPI